MIFLENLVSAVNILNVCVKRKINRYNFYTPVLKIEIIILFISYQIIFFRFINLNFSIRSNLNFYSAIFFILLISLVKNRFIIFSQLWKGMHNFSGEHMIK